MHKRKTAVVTGCASGIGLEMARILASKGFDIYMVDIQQEVLEKLKPEFEKEFSVHIFIQSIDLSEPNAAEIIFNDCTNKNLAVEILINNAGFFFFSEVAQSNPARSSKMIQLHIQTPSLLAIYFSKYMKEKKHGYILMVSSISAYKDFPGIGFYAASKSYIKSFCRSLRYEMKYYGVSVTTLCPGATATNLYDPNVIDVKKGKRWGIMMDANKVAASGIKGMFNKKAIVIPGLITKLMTLFSILTPKWIIYWARVKWRKFF